MGSMEGRGARIKVCWLLGLGALGHEAQKSRRTLEAGEQEAKRQ